jgi:hypothetical protein
MSELIGGLHEGLLIPPIALLVGAGLAILPVSGRRAPAAAAETAA